MKDTLKEIVCEPLQDDECVVHCNNCFKYLGNRETGALSAGVIKRLKEMKLYGGVDKSN